MGNCGSVCALYMGAIRPSRVDVSDEAADLDRENNRSNNPERINTNVSIGHVRKHNRVQLAMERGPLP